MIVYFSGNLQWTTSLCTDPGKRTQNTRALWMKLGFSFETVCMHDHNIVQRGEKTYRVIEDTFVFVLSLFYNREQKQAKLAHIWVAKHYIEQMVQWICEKKHNLKKTADIEPRIESARKKYINISMIIKSRAFMAKFRSNETEIELKNPEKHFALVIITKRKINAEQFFFEQNMWDMWKWVCITNWKNPSNETLIHR